MGPQTVDKALSFLRDAGGQLGVGLDYAWPTVVRYMWAQAVATILVLLTGAVLTCVVMLYIRQLMIATDARMPDTDGDKGALSLFSFTPVIIGAAVLLCILCSLAYWLPIAIAPEGAAIMQLIGKATGAK